MTTRVVLADDHPLVLQGLTAVVELMDDMALVGTAMTGTEAVEVCCREDPDLVVMDLRMPELDGMAATRAILGHSRRPRILVLSMQNDDESLFGAVRAGAHGYLLKGAGHEEVSRALRGVAAGDAVFGVGVAARALRHFGADAPAPPDPLAPLSSREREVLERLAAGDGTKEIARRLYLSPKTVRNHISNIVAKLHLSDRAHAIAFGREAGLARPGDVR